MSSINYVEKSLGNVTHLIENFKTCYYVTNDPYVSLIVHKVADGLVVGVLLVVFYNTRVITIYYNFIMNIQSRSKSFNLCTFDNTYTTFRGAD